MLESERSNNETGTNTGTNEAEGTAPAPTLTGPAQMAAPAVPAAVFQPPQVLFQAPAPVAPPSADERDSGGRNSGGRDTSGRDSGGRADGDRGVPTGPADQVSLGRQLLVRLDHDTTGDAQVSGQYAGRRQHGVPHQRAGTDRGPDGADDLPVQRHRPVAVQLDEQHGIGPGSGHRTGPYQQDQPRPG